MIPTAEDILEEKGSEVISVSPETTIYNALQLMVGSTIGAIMVKEGEKYVGIWTERDLMRNTINESFDPKTAKIGDYMTRELLFVPHDTAVYKIKDIFLGKRVCRMLVVRHDQFIGLLTVGDVIRASLQEREKEVKKLSELVNLEYYDEWRWKKKRK
jgi:signal-transduction protein with cAMP-binding, CBS, and nucleotidyltransferase domain